jgi:hypothetical protein
MDFVSHLMRGLEFHLIHYALDYVEAETAALNDVGCRRPNVREVHFLAEIPDADPQPCFVHLAFQNDDSVWISFITMSNNVGTCFTYCQTDSVAVFGNETGGIRQFRNEASGKAQILGEGRESEAECFAERFAFFFAHIGSPRRFLMAIA